MNFLFVDDDEYVGCVKLGANEIFRLMCQEEEQARIR
jgi:hypothetical protein